MPILERDLRIYGSATMPEDDTTTQIGGAIATSVKPILADLIVDGGAQIVSSAVGDTTQQVTTTYRDPAGLIQSEAKTLNGTTPVALTAVNLHRILKAVKSATTTGDVALEAATAERTGTAQAGDADSITLDAGASAVDNAYRGMVLRLTGGTGSGQIREVVRYDGATKKAWVSAAWGTNPDATSTFRIARGVFFDKSPVEILTVRRPFYNAQAPTAGTKDVYDKVFIRNGHGSLTLQSAQVKESSDPLGRVAFGLEASLGGSTTNGAGNNRTVAPAGITFDSADKNVANSGNHTAGADQAVWLKLSLQAGDLAQAADYVLVETGLSGS